MWRLLVVVVLAAAVRGQGDDGDAINIEMRGTSEFSEFSCGGVVDTCVICDTACQTRAIFAGFSSAEDYIREFLGKVSRLFKKNKMNIGFRLKERLLGNTLVHLRSYIEPGAEGSEITGSATGNLWKAQNYGTTLKNQGCELGLYLSANDDALWQEVKTLGAASFGGICRIYSYGSVKMERDIDSSVAIAMHELGHLFCMAHDRHPPDSGFTQEPYATYAAKMIQECQDGEAGCSDPSMECFMEGSAAHGAGGSKPQKFSACSLAGFDFWCSISTAGVSNYYSSDCLSPSDQSANEWQNSNEKGYMDNSNYSPVADGSGD